jgi:hypothetical protein
MVSRQQSDWVNMPVRDIPSGNDMALPADDAAAI